MFFYVMAAFLLTRKYLKWCEIFPAWVYRADFRS